MTKRMRITIDVETTLSRGRFNVLALQKALNFGTQIDVLTWG